MKACRGITVRQGAQSGVIWEQIGGEVGIVEIWCIGQWWRRMMAINKEKIACYYAAETRFYIVV